MNGWYLTAASFTVYAVLHHSLKWTFRLLEKAHEHQRTPGPRNSGVQRSGERGA